MTAPAIERHDAEGFWVAEAGPREDLPPLAGTVDADVVVIGGGYTGLWTAWQVLELEPEARVVVLEAGRCGTGPSGRNGGFVNSLWYSLPHLTELHGTEAAGAACRWSAQSVRDIGAWCAAQEVEAWYRPADHLLVSTGAEQDGAWEETGAALAAAGAGAEQVALGPAEVQARCASPVLRAGAAMRTAATVQPARLALGLRERLRARGAAIYEHSRVRELRMGGGEAPALAATDGGRVRAAAAVVAVNAAAAGLRPLRGRLTVGSSHMVITEPVPDVVEALGWTGGEAISDVRTLLHYTRTTPDGRIAFGWAGGRMGCGARLGGRVQVDPEVAQETARRLVRFFPGLAGRRVVHAWGGPIDVAPEHLPMVGSLPGGPAWFAAGYTGNGVGPSHLCGRILASLALDRRDEASRLCLVDPPRGARVPPEPLRWAGGALIRRALVRADLAADAGRAADPLTRFAATLPERMGVHLVR